MESKTRKPRGRSRAVKPRSSRGRGRPPRARVSGKKACVIESDPEDEIVETVVHDVVIEEDQCSFQVPGSEEIQEIMENKIELLTESIMEKNEPIMALDWSHKVNLIGEKVINPLIHCCDLCTKPILVYGRMIPCKHVFCLTCSKQDLKQCPRCSEKISRVESSGLGSVFMCTHDGSRYGNDGCRRTYLSQRDLQAHINHRHVNLSGRII